MIRIRKEKLTTLFGVVAGAIFVAQMLNWPIPGGTSAHFVGGALAAILLGPYAGALAMAIVLTIQAIVFNDGGITAWGANVWNMAIVNVFLGYYIYRALKRFGVSIASFFAGWIGITVAAIFAGVEIGLSTSAVSYIATRRPEALEKKEIGKVPIVIVGILLILTPVFAYLSEEVGYSEPLDKAAEILGLEENKIYEGIFPDYTIPGLDPYLGTLISGIIGLVIVLLLAIGLKYAYSSRKNP